MKASTLRTFTTVHTWAGLLAGFALFIAFYAGALTMFHDEIDTWAVPHAAADTHETMARGDAMLREIVRQHPAAKAQIGITLPGDHPSHEIAAYWFDKGWQTQALADATPHPSEEHEHALADFIYELHYSLGIPEIGIYLLGIVSVVYGLALLTGLLIHLPNLLRELFALRPGHNLKRLWQDAHNVIGILSLPFHIIFAVTGALLCLMLVTMAAFNVLVFDGKLLAVGTQLTNAMPAVVASNTPAPMLGADVLVARAKAAALAAGADGFDPDYMYFAHYGDANAAVEVRGTSGKTLGEYGTVALGAVDGHVLRLQVAGARDANHATYAAIYGAHFGSYGHYALRWLYFLLGLAGAFLFYSGNLLYIETRRKRRQADQPLKARAMATATVGVCIGSCLAMSSAFVANHVAGALGSAVPAAVQGTCFIVFFAAIGWTLWRKPARAAVDLLWATAAATLAIPVLDLLLHGDRAMAALREARWAAPGLDLVAVAMACGFAWLAVATRRRGRQGDANSVWSSR
jgi:uncharacterized iron-regulated membrane protein